jgi:hypothetical protein
MKGYQAGLNAFRDEVEKAFMAKAQVKLSSTFDEFKDGVRVAIAGDGVEIHVEGWLPVALETGHERFDMKPGLLDGRDYRVIPMHDGEFRTVSKNSPSESWWHPGFEPRNIHKDIEDDVDGMLKRSFTPAFDRIKV